MLYNYFKIAFRSFKKNKAYSAINLATAQSLTRTTEVDIRKVLGAEVFDIIWSFIKNYSLLIVISNVLAWLVAYLLMKNWLQDFAYSIIPVGFFEFVLAGIAIFLISIGIITLVAYKTTQLNPVNTLKNE